MQPLITNTRILLSYKVTRLLVLAALIGLAVALASLLAQGAQAQTNSSSFTYVQVSADLAKNGIVVNEGAPVIITGGAKVYEVNHTVGSLPCETRYKMVSAGSGEGFATVGGNGSDVKPVDRTRVCAVPAGGFQAFPISSDGRITQDSTKEGGELFFITIHETSKTKVRIEGGDFQKVVYIPVFIKDDDERDRDWTLTGNWLPSVINVKEGKKYSLPNIFASTRRPGHLTQCGLNQGEIRGTAKAGDDYSLNIVGVQCRGNRISPINTTITAKADRLDEDREHLFLKLQATGNAHVVAKGIKWRTLPIPVFIENVKPPNTYVSVLADRPGEEAGSGVFPSKKT